MESRKKILIVSSSFYPTNSPRSLRTTELVKEFARRGHDVTLLTIKNDADHVPFEKKHGVTIKNMGKPWFPDITINSKFGPLRLLKRIMRRLLLLLFEYPHIELMYRVARALRQESGYDLMISIAMPYPVHWGVAKVRQKNHKIAQTWVADCGDPYCGLENDSFKPPFYFSYIEKWFCRKADYISIPLEAAKPAYFSEFHSKIRIIPQGLTFPEQRRHTNKAGNGVPTFAYFGNIRSYMHYAEPFLKKLNSIEQPFTFIIYTKDPGVYTGILTPETQKKCSLRTYTRREKLLEELSDVDFLLHFPYLKGSQKSLKLIDYYYLDKPILAYTNDELSDKALNEFLALDFKNGAPIEDYSKYDVRNVCTQFLELIPQKMQLVAI